MDSNGSPRSIYSAGLVGTSRRRKNTETWWHKVRPRSQRCRSLETLHSSAHKFHPDCLGLRRSLTGPIFVLRDRTEWSLKVLQLAGWSEKQDPISVRCASVTSQNPSYPLRARLLLFHKESHTESSWQPLQDTYQYSHLIGRETKTQKDEGIVRDMDPKAHILPPPLHFLLGKRVCRRRGAGILRCLSYLSQK